MQAVLVMFRSDGERRSFSVTRDMTVIGRREDCDLRIPLGEISRKHCRLVRDGDMLKIEDLGSSNGTFLNGQRVQEALLSPGDSIQVGPVVFVLQVDGEPDDDELMPVTMAAPDTGADDTLGSLADVMMSNDDSAAPQPTHVGEGEGVEDVEVLEDADELQEITAEDSGVEASGAVDLDEIPPLEQLDPLEPDLDLTEEENSRHKLEG